MSNISKEHNWFESWFDSPFYHKLYCNRDFSEAKKFIYNLTGLLHLKPDQKVLDLACGKGRHAYYLSQLGLNVIGLDLAENSIAEANKLAHEKLHFDVHDMRNIYPDHSFDAIFNLFTSFGYFDTEEDNIKMLTSINTMLHPDGILVIDFMNTDKVVKELIKQETKIIEEITFNIERKFDGNHIFKDIRFQTEGQNFHFTERVQALTNEDFEYLLEKTQFKIISRHGDYKLSKFDADKTPRLIIIAKKK